MEVEYGISERGKPTVIYKNFEYVKECNNVNGTTAWRCRMYQRMKCKGRLVTSGNRVVSVREPEHTHSGNVSTALARKAVGMMKESMGELTATPSTSQASVCANLDDHVLMALPKRATLSRALQRKRRKLTEEAHPDQALLAIPVNLMFEIPQIFMDMVLFDSGPGDNRIIILGCMELLDGLARAEVWLADGTFKVVPSIFFQLYSIHFNFGLGINPAALYCLLTNKTEDTYTRVLQEVKRLVPLAYPKKILVDFERAAMNAFSLAYPDATVTGCYFHLCQSITKKVNEIGLKTEYENNNEVRGYVRCLPALAFVPPEDVLEAFELLAESMPENIDHVDELTTFFEHTYVRGRRRRGRGQVYGTPLFSIESWNQQAAGGDGIARTTNSVEGWHHGLQTLFMCSHPTLWTFISGLKKDMQKQKAVFLQGATGIEHVTCKRYRILNERVHRAVSTYGRSEVLMFLRAIAHLSHT